jgi:hypothetical protein
MFLLPPMQMMIRIPAASDAQYDPQIHVAAPIQKDPDHKGHEETAAEHDHHSDETPDTHQKAPHEHGDEENAPLPETHDDHGYVEDAPADHDHENEPPYRHTHPYQHPKPAPADYQQDGADFPQEVQGYEIADHPRKTRQHTQIAAHVPKKIQELEEGEEVPEVADLAQERPHIPLVEESATVSCKPDKFPPNPPSARPKPLVDHGQTGDTQRDEK